MKNYNPSIGYLKALGIMLMVLGHSGNNLYINDFIYMFHMPLFFITSGFCFKQKYLDMPRSYIYNKMKGVWFPFVKWGLIFLLLHNVLFRLNIYNDQYGWQGCVSHIYTVSESGHLALSIVFKMLGAEQLLGGYWFLNALFFGSIIAWTLIRFVKNTLFRGAILFFICTILNKICCRIPFLGFTSQTFAAALFIIIGYAMAKRKLKIFNGWQVALGLAVTLFGSFFWNMEMNLDWYSNRRLAPYIITASIATWCLYSLFKRKAYSQGLFAKLMTFIGKNTLTILTWHFLSFKLVSLSIILIYKLPIERLAEFPVIREYASQGWWIAYFFVAMVVTCGIAYCNKWIRNPWLKL